MGVIDSGLITESLKSHLVELEAERASLEAGIAKAKVDAPNITRESVIWFLTRFRDMDQRDTRWRIYLVETFLQAAYLYDDGRLLLHLNFSGENNVITAEFAEEVASFGEELSSNSAHLGAPSKPLKPEGFKGFLF